MVGLDVWAFGHMQPLDFGPVSGGMESAGKETECIMGELADH